MKRFLILAVVGGLGLSACASAVSPAASRPARDASPVMSSSPGAKSSVERSEPKSCEPASGGTEGSLAQLADVRVGTHEGYDRVTFEFEPPSDGQYFGLPPYTLVEATPPITQDGSGEPVPVDGSQFAVVIFHGAAGYDFVEGTPSYSGPKDFRPDFPMLVEARETGDFEATLSWAFGLHGASCWRVQELQNPVRVVIDFPHD